MLAYTGPPAALGPAETFFRGLGDTPRAGAKVAALLFSRQFCSVAEDAERRVETLKMVRDLQQQWFFVLFCFVFLYPVVFLVCFVLSCRVVSCLCPSPRRRNHHPPRRG